MTQEKDLCPLNTSGDHRYFIFKSIEVFVPFKTPENWAAWDTDKFVQLYQRIEYATMGCNCGSAIKTEVKQL
jgi:hypothetical protein